MTHRQGGTIDEITNAPGTTANFQQDDPESSQGLVSPRKKSIGHSDEQHTWF